MQKGDIFVFQMLQAYSALKRLPAENASENADVFCCNFSSPEGKGKKEGKDQESIQSSTTPDPGYQWESDNFTIRHHK